MTRQAVGEQGERREDEKRKYTLAHFNQVGHGLEQESQLDVRSDPVSITLLKDELAVRVVFCQLVAADQGRFPRCQLDLQVQGI